MGQIGCNETSAITIYTLRNIQEEPKNLIPEVCIFFNSDNQNHITFKKPKMWCSDYETLKIPMIFYKREQEKVNERRGEENSKKF
jgi:hypothetical protein